MSFSWSELGICDQVPGPEPRVAGQELVVTSATDAWFEFDLDRLLLDFQDTLLPGNIGRILW